MSPPDHRARAPVPRAEGAGRRQGAAEARRPRPRRRSGATSSSPPPLLKTEIDSRDSHGGQARIKAARFPAHKTLEEFDFAFQRSIKKTDVAAPRPARLPRTARRTSSCSARPAPARRTSRSRSAIRACLAGHRVAVPHRDRMGRAACRRPTPRPPRRTSSTSSQRDPAADRRRGRLHPVRPPSREPDVHARLPPLRTRQR